MPLLHIRKILKMVQLDCIQEVEVNGSWYLSTLARKSLSHPSPSGSLELNGCGIMDYQLIAILPTLGHCSQLTTFSCCGNPVSMAALENLLQHTVLLSKFRLELFPVPLGCYVGI
ncbi:PRAME family member 8-like [Trichechus inunguis]